MFAHDVKVLGHDVIKLFKATNHEQVKATLIVAHDPIDKMVEKEMAQLKAIKDDKECKDMCDVRTEINYYHTHKCLACGHQDRVNYPSKEAYQEVTVCPKCNGAFVDMWKLEKYKQSNETVEPLLTITLSDIDAKPIVHYKGKQIDRKLRVAFDWETQSIDKINRTYIHIEHVPSDNKRFNTEVIQHNHPIVEDQVELYRL